MAKREKSSEIDDAAAAWAARLDSGLLAPEEFEALQRWLAEDTRRFGALARAQAMLTVVDRAKGLGPFYDPSQFKTPAAPDVPRRSVLRWGAAAAGLAGVGLAGRLVWGLMPDHFRTAQGEIRIQPLPDGSVMTLNTKTEVAVQMSKSSRDIHLVKGEALFDVAKDARRPFVVRMGQMEVRAVGTSFALRRIPDIAEEIVVREGVVEIGPGNPNRTGTEKSRRAGANTKITAAVRGPMVVTQMSADETKKLLSWQQGMISFNATSLRDAVAEFARYSDFQITITDSAVAERTVTGLFSAFNPAGFAKAVATSLGLKLELRDHEAVLRS